jgi:hypothetical protein
MSRSKKVWPTQTRGSKFLSKKWVLPNEDTQGAPMVHLTPVQEKLFNYLASHKRPVTIAKLAHHFLINAKAVGSELRALHLMGLADRTKIKRKFFYEIKQ